MTKSESIQNLAKALSQFQGKCETINLNKKVKVTMKSGGSYFFEYATFDHILSIVKPVLNEFGLSFTQLLEEQGTITTVLMHESGEWIATTTKVQSNGTIQDLGGHYSYLKRYSLCAILGVVGEEDDDANASVGNKVEVQKDILKIDTDPYFKVIKYLADNDSSGKAWKDVEQKFIIPKELMPEMEADIAKFIDPTGHGMSASAEQIKQKVKAVAK